MSYILFSEKQAYVHANNTVINIAWKNKLCKVDLMLNTLKMGSLKMGSQALLIMYVQLRTLSA